MTQGLARTVIVASGKFALTASRAGMVITASPTQFVARIRIEWIFDLSMGFPICEYHYFQTG
jgi:hypothetical protein